MKVYLIMFINGIKMGSFMLILLVIIDWNLLIYSLVMWEFIGCILLILEYWILCWKVFLLNFRWVIVRMCWCVIIKLLLVLIWVFVSLFLVLICCWMVFLIV